MRTPCTHPLDPPLGKRRILYTSLHVYYKKLWYCCFNSVQRTPLPPNNVDNKGRDKGCLNQHCIGGGGKDCMVKRMRNFAHAFANM